MLTQPAITLQSISKVFKHYHRPVDRLKDLLLPGKTRGEEFWALRNISLEIARGETVGLVGRNGSGKSTLLQIIAGTLQPTTGTVNVEGRVSALLELGSGFNPEFTGRQNIFFNGRILGLSQADIESKYDDIVAFADIGSFIDEPVKTYSSGMFVRLAFAIAINVEPDILIVDEALSVGDGVFVHRCMAKVKAFQESGGTILFVSHDTGSVVRLCQKAYWLKSGEIAQYSSAKKVCKSYQAWMLDEINIETKKKQDQQDSASDRQSQQIVDKRSYNPFTQRSFLSFKGAERSGTGRCEIVQISLLDKLRQATYFIMPTEQATIRLEVLAHDVIENPVVGVQMFDRLRTAIVGWNTAQYESTLPSLSPGQRLAVEFTMQWPSIVGGSYILEPAVADGSQDNHEILDWLFTQFSIESGMQGLTFGLLKVEDVAINAYIQQDYAFVEKSVN